MLLLTWFPVVLQAAEAAKQEAEQRFWLPLERSKNRQMGELCVSLLLTKVSLLSSNHVLLCHVLRQQLCRLTLAAHLAAPQLPDSLSDMFVTWHAHVATAAAWGLGELASHALQTLLQTSNGLQSKCRSD